MRTDPATATRTTAPGRLPWLRGPLRARVARVPERAVRAGLVPPAWFDWRWVREEPLDSVVARGNALSHERIHEPAVADNPLPRNVARREDLPDEAGWWGYAMRDVPTRASGRTLLATLPERRIVAFTEPSKRNYYPVVLDRRGRSAFLREMPFRPGHREALARGAPAQRRERVAWIAERVYHNHSHWLTAHVPKLCLLEERGLLGDLALPARSNPAIDATLRMFGLDPAAVCTIDPDLPLEVGELTLVDTDRFRPELLRLVRDRLGPVPERAPWRRVLISRAKARGRRLENEAALEPLLAKAGFESVVMEELGFAEQARLMSETAVLLAPHGAGLTNMIFCRPGTQIVEIADLSFPNPNFYALASAMGLGYWLVEGRFCGDPALAPLDRDLAVEPARVEAVLRALGG
ncbi:MAG: glycosyltransferase family 61 protein [Salinarimonas sp.]